VPFSVGAQWGTWGVRWLGILRASWRAPEREHLSLQKLCWGGSFLGTWKDMGRRAQGMDIILCGGPTGEFSRGLVYRALRRLWRRAPFSIGALLNIMGRPFTGNSERYLKGGSGNGASLSMGALLGEPGGAPLLRALKVMKGRLWGWASLFMGAQVGNLEWAHLPGTLRYG